ncbi:hypothetical protein [Peredibacter starrii]|uniref:Uncharacterized protein n=1 Tax=Peredibacter starrii TaxID=28202 RepID=A0AAX4HJN4_9BACT|nr:hypothetical protein [Peredibacter starrii]WPU63449.1 hypothetical protein SOO65_12195 [Peredibacter starrii]
MKVLIIILLSAFSLHTSAKDRATVESLTSLMEETRNPVIDQKTRLESLHFSRRMMEQLLSKDVGVPVKDLNRYFLQSATAVQSLYSDDWYDLQTEFYTTLHQEIFYQRLEAMKKNYKITEYGTNIATSMIGHLGDFSPRAEGRFYIRTNKVSVGVVQGKSRSSNVPFFLMSSNMNDLLAMDAHTPFEELFPTAKNETTTNPSLDTFMKHTPITTRALNQELAEKMQINHRIGIRAAANSAKTIASIYYLTNELNRSQTENKVARFVNANCEGCTPREKSDFTKGAMTYVDNMRKVIQVVSTENLAKNFCSSLKKNGYIWDLDKSKPHALEMIADGRNIVRYVKHRKLSKKNQEILTMSIMEQDMGILFLTRSMNEMNNFNEPAGTNLRCVPSTLKKDAELIRLAIKEAEANVEEYMTRVNVKILKARYDRHASQRALEYFIQTNQAATAEALVHFPQGIKDFAKAVIEVDKDVKRRETTDNVITWGGNIIGVGLILTGIGAPEGAAVLIATAGVVKSVSSGTYFAIRSQQEKKFAREILLAKKGTEDFLIEANLRKHYSEYMKLKVQYIKEFASTGISFFQLQKTALAATGGSVEESHKLLHKVFDAAKSQGQDMAQEKISEMVIQFALNMR